MDQETVIKCAIVALQSAEHDVGVWAAIIITKNILIYADKELQKEFDSKQKFKPPLRMPSGLVYQDD